MSVTTNKGSLVVENDRSLEFVVDLLTNADGSYPHTIWDISRTETGFVFSSPREGGFNTPEPIALQYPAPEESMRVSVNKSAAIKPSMRTIYSTDLFSIKEFIDISREVNCSNEYVRFLLRLTEQRGARFPLAVERAIFDTSIGNKHLMWGGFTPGIPWIKNGDWRWWSDDQLSVFVKTAERLPILEDETPERGPRMVEVAPGLFMPYCSRPLLGEGWGLYSAFTRNNKGHLDTYLYPGTYPVANPTMVLSKTMFPFSSKDAFEATLRIMCREYASAKEMVQAAKAAVIADEISKNTGLVMPDKARDILVGWIKSVPSCGVVQSAEGLWVGSLSRDGRIRYPKIAGFIPDGIHSADEIVAPIVVYGRMRRRNEWPGMEDDDRGR